MRLTYIYHSGFAIEADEFAILIDYYKDTGRSPEKGFVHEKLLNRAGTLYVLSSHFHPDHFLQKQSSCLQNPESFPDWKSQGYPSSPGEPA